MYQEIKKELQKLANPAKAKIYLRFFKTGKDEYGEGDVFLGINVPNQHKVATKFYKNVRISEVKKLLRSRVHEHRQVALMILVEKFKRVTEVEKKEIFNLYLDYTKWINNWDLVDLSSPKIVGVYLFNTSRNVLYCLAKSKNLWEKRISIVSTYEFIRNKDYKDTLKIAKILIHDKHDLIHKAVGWMLREVGKRNLKAEIEFLDKHYKQMPRTMLRYAIEKFDLKLRKHYMESAII